MQTDTSIVKSQAASPKNRLRQFLQAQVLVPVLITACFWLVMSLSTNLYMQWVETEYNGLFSRNFQMVRAASLLSTSAWSCLSSWNDDSISSEKLKEQWNLQQKRITELVDAIEQGDSDPEFESDRKTLVATVLKINAVVEFEETRTGAQRQTDIKTAGQIKYLAETAAMASLGMTERNLSTISVRRGKLATIHSQVVLLRFALLLLGLPIGLFLGWRVSRRLQTNVTQIAVTLSDKESLCETPEMTVNITQNSSLEEIQRQAERVVERLRSVGSELRSARKEVIQSERLAAVGELAAGVAHELRNPLTSVKLLLQHAARQSDGFRIDRPQLALILEEISRMETTIQGLLDFSRTPSLNHIQHDLRTTLQRSLNLADGRIRQASLQVHTSMSAGPLWVNGDAEQLNQVFVNLLLNSIEATPASGSIYVSAQAVPEANLIRVIISDTGPGIAREIMMRLFEPFATTRSKGTGLGLPICRRIVTEHKGTIVAGTGESGGAKLTVELPACPHAIITDTADKDSFALH
jgi:signal transduction histidine kinase